MQSAQVRARMHGLGYGGYLYNFDYDLSKHSVGMICGRQFFGQYM